MVFWSGCQRRTDASSSSVEEPRVVKTLLFALQPNNCFAAEQKPAFSTFPKSVRLRKRVDFTRLFDSIHKCNVKGFLVVWQANGLTQPRLGVTVSKKVGCAVIRNRIKRYTREIFRHNRLLLLPVDVNVIARRESAMMDFRSVMRELERAFRHIGVPSCSRASHST